MHLLLGGYKASPGRGTSCPFGGLMSCRRFRSVSWGCGGGGLAARVSAAAGCGPHMVLGVFRCAFSIRPGRVALHTAPALILGPPVLPEETASDIGCLLALGRRRRGG